MPQKTTKILNLLLMVLFKAHRFYVPRMFDVLLHDYKSEIIYLQVTVIKKVHLAGWIRFLLRSISVSSCSVFFFSAR